MCVRLIGVHSWKWRRCSNGFFDVLCLEKQWIAGDALTDALQQPFESFTSEMMQLFWNLMDTKCPDGTQDSLMYGCYFWMSVLRCGVYRYVYGYVQINVTSDEVECMLKILMD